MIANVSVDLNSTSTAGASAGGPGGAAAPSFADILQQFAMQTTLDIVTQPTSGAGSGAAKKIVGSPENPKGAADALRQDDQASSDRLRGHYRQLEKEAESVYRS